MRLVSTSTAEHLSSSADSKNLHKSGKGALVVVPMCISFITDGADDDTKIGQGYQGEVKQVISDNQFVVEEYVEERIRTTDPSMPEEVKEYYVDKIYIVEEVKKTHSAFNAYAF